MQQSKKVNVRYITFTAVMAALVFVFTFTSRSPWAPATPTWAI